MPSPAATSFAGDVVRARVLFSLARDRRLRPISRGDSQACLHAALAAYVACWDKYIKGLISNFFDEISDPALPKFLALHTITKNRSEVVLKKFNTPNFENTRESLATSTGYDPINDWVWPRRGMSGLQLRERLNETLKVRHSFAHGAPMPSYQWNTSSAGDVRLTTGAISETEAFFRNLVLQTDLGMQQHIRATYNAALAW